MLPLTGSKTVTGSLPMRRSSSADMLPWVHVDPPSNEV
jgi:hypothetical protein